MVRSRKAAQAVHNDLVVKAIMKARANGSLAHEPYFRVNPPGTPESLEFFAVDVWMDSQGMGRHYEDPEFMPALMEMFAAEPATTAWVHPAGNWVEW